MWDQNKFQLLKDKKSSEPFITHYEKKTNSNFLTYTEVFDLYLKFSKIISNTIQSKWSVIGLYMDFNKFIPSIIMSLLNSYTFVFLDPNCIDNSRNKYIINEGEMKWIITYKTCVKNLEKHCTHAASLQENLDLYVINDTNQSKCVFEDIAYITFSSGTTGKPKLIRVKNYCIFSNVTSLRDHFNLSHNDVIFFNTPLSFDPSMVELLLSLTVPCPLVSVSSKCKLDPNLFQNIFNEKLITFLQIVPSVFLRWGDEIIENILSNSSLKHLAFGGEPFPVHIFKFKRKKDLNIYNLYGISEVSCWASICKVSKEESCFNLGEKLNDTILEVRNENGFKITEGEGEMFIGSELRICLIEENLELSKPVFRATGDIVKIFENSYFFIGRKDSTIKRFGNKVNLNIMEDLIFQITNLNSAVIWLEVNQKLIVFISLKVANKEMKNKIEDNIKRKLINSLSKEMFPDVVEIISVFPLTSNGKINKKSLSELYFLSLKQEKNNLKITEIFELLWVKSLGLNFEDLKLYKKSNFFELGGTSFIFLQVVNEFENITKIKVSDDLKQLILNSSFKESLEYVDKCFSKLSERKFHDENMLTQNYHFEETEDIGNLTIKFKWSHDLKGCVQIPPEIVTYNDRNLVLCVSFYQVFAIIDLDTGQMISEMIFPEPVQGGICAGNDGKAYVGCLDGFMYCIDINNCQIVWSFKTNDIIKSKPCFCLEGKAICFGSYDGYVYCVSVEKGKVIWKNNVESSVLVNPIYNSELKRIFLSSKKKCFCLSEVDGSLIWKYNVNSPLLGSPTVAKFGLEDCILWPEVEGMVHCTKCSTGELLWIFKAENQIYSSVIFYENYILFGCKDKNVYCCSVSEKDCFLNFKIFLNSEITPTPSTFKIEDKLYVCAISNEGVIYLINFLEKKIEKKIKMNEKVFCSPVVFQSKILFGCNDNNLYCFSIKND